MSVQGAPRKISAHGIQKIKHWEGEILSDLLRSRYRQISRHGVSGASTTPQSWTI